MKGIKRAISITLAVVMLLSLGISASAAGNPFVDVKESDWFYFDVMKVFEAGYMAGTDATHFAPNDTLTRAMIVTILWRVEGSPEGNTCNFSDVKNGTWYYKAVAWAQANGIVSGVGNGKYAPEQTLTREQMAAIIYRYAQNKLNAQKTDFNYSAYSDTAQISGYAKDGISWLMAQKALHCEGNRIRPQDPAKRAEVAAGAALFLEGGINPQPSENGLSAYEIAVKNGFTGTEEEWLESLAGADGHDGADGKSAYDLAVENGYIGTVQEWLASLAGDGKNGADGKSAYEIAVEQGYTGTEIEWIRSLAGKDGKSAYEIAVEHGYVGSEVEWLASLVGEAGKNGNDGASAYTIAVENGYTGTIQEWLASLIGPSGAVGKNGADGKSAFELAVELGFTGDLASWLDTLRGSNGKDGASAYDLAVANGYTGSLTQWLASLVGANGASAYELAVSNGYKGTLQEWLASLVGATGADGKSAYELAVEKGYVGTLDQWLASLAGKNGIDGKSAYELAVEKGFEGTETEWLQSLVGKNGTDGANGQDGTDGVGIANAYVNDESHLILTMTDGSTIDAGAVGGSMTAATSYSVVFKDYDGTILAERLVDKGGNATPPANPTREGFVFVGWEGSYTNVQSNTIVVAKYEKAEPGTTYYQVVFKDYDGSILSTQQVIAGGNAIPPDEPERAGYLFVAWSGTYTNVTANTVVTATYIVNTEPTLVVSKVNAAPGASEVIVAISIRNNPGILGMTLTVSYDESALTMTGASNGDAVSKILTLTKAKILHSGCNFVWDGQEISEEDIVDGEVLIMTFSVSGTAAAGDYPITISYNATDIVNADLSVISPAIRNGCVTIVR